MSRGKLLLLGVLALVVVALVVVSIQAPQPSLSVATARPIPTIGGGEAAPHPVAAFVGDSYTTGTGAKVKVKTRWTSIVSAEMKWREVNLGRGGTGYATSSGPSGCGREYCPSFPEMVPEVVEASPDIVFISGGKSDIRAWDADAAAVVAAINETYTAMRAALPKARIIAIGPAVTGTVTQAMIDMNTAVQAAAAASGAEFISLLDPSVLDSSLLAADKIHPNNRGYAAIAARVLKVAAP